MSSIKAKDNLAAVRKFFLKELMPLAKKFRAEGRTLFPLKADPNVNTYYQKRERTRMSPKDFEVAGCSSSDSIEQALSDMWTAQGYPELTVLAPTLSKLAISLHSTDQPEEEVSTFIYVMF
ncbi:hypothetical protein ACFLYQ_06735 [Chloroflexota bacterium]